MIAYEALGAHWNVFGVTQFAQDMMLLGATSRQNVTGVIKPEDGTLLSSTTPDTYAESLTVTKPATDVTGAD